MGYLLEYHIREFTDMWAISGLKLSLFLTEQDL